MQANFALNALCWIFGNVECTQKFDLIYVHLVVEADFFTHMYMTNMYMNELMNAISLVA